MDNRLSNIEAILRLHESLMQEMVEAQEMLDDSQRQMAGNQVRIAENLVRIGENQRFLDGSRRRTNELIQQILQAVAVMQADIVRIDESRSQ